MTRTDALSGRDRRLIDALSMGATQVTAAEFAGCSRATVTRRLRDPAFRTALAKAEHEMHSTLVRRVTAEGIAALGRMSTRAKDAHASPNERLQADARILAAAVALLPRRLEADVAVDVTASTPGPSLQEWLDRITENRQATDHLFRPPQLVASSNGDDR